MREYYRVQAEIDLDAIYENVAAAKELTKEGTKLLAVVKADAYGHGAVQTAQVLEPLADAYGVAILEEGIELRKAGIGKPILILGFTPEPLYEPMIRYEIATAVFQYDMAEKIADTAVRIGKTAKIHIKLDTGMHRIGFSPSEESVRVIADIAKLPGIFIEGCFTHFARMDERDKASAKGQLEQYLAFVEQLEREGVTIPVKHVSNSAGIIDMQEANLDMVRDGISIYGMYPSGEVMAERIALKPAMQLKAFVSYVKTVPAGTEIGYGGTYVTGRETTVATIPAGYADGYPRALSNRGRVLLHGQSAPIIGRVCMDQFMVDVTDIQGVREGDTVTLFGTDGEETLSAEEVAELSYSFHYELLCNVGKRVPRVYMRDGKRVAASDFYPDF